MYPPRSMAVFLFFFLMAGQGCYAQDAKTQEPVHPVSSSANPGQVRWSADWYQNADGYAKAVEEYERTNKPLFVYMSVTWCPYCRRFEKEVLSSPEVREFLRDKIKVMINPEFASRENVIARKYGVQGFPSLYLHPPHPGRAVQLYTGVTPEDFIEQVQQVLR